MAVERKPGKVNRQNRLSRGNSHYELLSNGLHLQEITALKQENARKPIPVRSFIVPERNHKKVGLQNYHLFTLIGCRNGKV